MEHSWALGMEALYLAGCALRGRIPERKASCSLEELLEFCRFHTVTAIVAMGLEALWKESPPECGELRSQWTQARDQSIRKNLLFNTERQAILGHLESLHCWHMPLKGSVLQYDYPKFGMRQMTDNDILVDPSKRQEIHGFMMERGYTAGFYLQNEVDTYQKPPVYNFEIHMMLFSKAEGEGLERYYRDIRDRAVKDPDNGWGYHLTNEDFYVYMIAHAHKHFVGGGVGIRNLLDVQVFLQKHGQDMDWDYVNRELKKLEVLSFEQMCRTLCCKLLDGDPAKAELTEAEQQALACFFTSGTFGTAQMQYASQFRRLQKDGGRITWGTKLKYILRRLVPTKEALRIDYPDIVEKPWKIPFILLWRPIRMLLHPVKTIRELRRISRVKDGG